MSEGDWSSQIDEATGATYYTNSSTGETTWTPPPGHPDAAPAAHDPWVEQADPSTGTAYYLNTETGETAWVHP